MDHSEWPRNGASSVFENVVLGYLAAWVVSVVEFTMLLERCGGRPIPLDHESLGTSSLASVIPVRDAQVLPQYNRDTDLDNG